ncbi:hypothetical protein Salat_0664700 [Sesamum alatum]|uniref:Uncharacterized protein n=1 Tax=Sesamum alatum TaxID=300844 RepID=A0AAE2CUI2_9LAMI|nr:hypothetical protein Salat_0664700 [Sesamum alatum]
MVSFGNKIFSIVSIGHPKIEGTFVQSLLAHHRKGTFHHKSVNCHVVLCPFLVAVEWDPKTNRISTDKYVWEQIAKAKSIGKAYVNTPEPQWSALWILFGECPSGNDFEDESVFFDCVGTCLDDEWVHDRPPSSNESSNDNSYGYIEDSDYDDPSWWPFVQEYYASDSGTTSVNKHSNAIHRPAMSGYGTPSAQSSQKDAATPSSCASNDLDLSDKTPSLYVPKYLRRRSPRSQSSEGLLQSGQIFNRKI